MRRPGRGVRRIAILLIVKPGLSTPAGAPGEVYALAGARGVRLDRVGCSCRQAGRLLRQTFERTSATVPGTANHLARPDLGCARLIVDVATAVASS